MPDEVVTDSPALDELLVTLEYLTSRWLREHCEGFSGESLDGILLGSCKRRGELDLEIGGTAILITDQTETPIALRMRANPTADHLLECLCRVGEPEPESGDLLRLELGTKVSYEARMRTAERPDRVPWMYLVEVGEGINGVSRATEQCDECASLYFRDSSGLAALCPECAHQLYDHPRCDHDFERGRCLRCFWDGAVSEYLSRR
jgi:hypothetical protein